MIPTCAGIERLRTEGDQFQYGGEMLCEDWQFPTADGRAHFYPAPLPSLERAPDEFALVTRRGKQFNSIVQDNVEYATGFPRDSVLISTQDARWMGLRDSAS